MIDEQKLSEVIQKHDLLNKSRLRHLVWKRCATAKFLRDNGYTLYQTGEAINKDHSNIVHLIKVYDNNSRYSDFKKLVKEVENDLAVCVLGNYESLEDINTKQLISLVNLENLIQDIL